MATIYTLEGHRGLGATKFPKMLGDITSGDPERQAVGVLFGLLSIASMAASAYHGAKRNCGSVGWGAVWGIAGAVFPVVTPAVAIGQGFAKSSGCSR